MSFAEVQFPSDIAYGSAGGPEFSTDIVVTHGGYEQRNINWSTSRGRYNVAYGVKTKEQLEALIAFFRARKGQAQGFRFKDWSDYSAVSESQGNGTGAKTQFQLQKRYVSGSDSYTRLIRKPVQSSVSLYLNGVLQTTGVTVNYTTGIITFSAAPGSGVAVTADFEFDVPVRFATDRLSARLESYGAYSAEDIPLIEVRA